MSPPADACFLPSMIFPGEEREGFVTCLTCMVASSEKENLGSCNDEEKEPFDATPASSGFLLTMTASNSFWCFYVRTSDLLISDAHLHIQRQRSSDKKIGVSKNCNWLHSSIYFSMKNAADLLRMHLPGARTNFITLLPEDKGFGIHFVSGSSDFSSWASLSYNRIPLYLIGIIFHGLPGKINGPGGLISNGQHSLASSTPVNKRRREEATWSSLPVLVLWMIKDKLDIIFDNIRFGAVCRDWRLASASYPNKTLHSVGDGLPWICHLKNGTQSSSREFISVPRKHKFVVDVPEFNEGVVLCSKDGWILLRKIIRFRPGEFAKTPVMVNPLTRARIELPELTGVRYYHGVFTTTLGGYPDRVFLITEEPKSDATTIKTACPGDRVWTSHVFPPPLERPCSWYFDFVAVGKKVCCRDGAYRNITVFDVANGTVKDSAPLSVCGFVAEHDGELIYVSRAHVAQAVRSSEVVYDFSSYKVYRYNDNAGGPSSFWEELSDGAVMDTSWYLRDDNSSCITAKGRGLKVYRIRQKKSRRDWRFLDSFLDVHDLVTGGVETLPVPFPDHHKLYWIGIG